MHEQLLIKCIHCINIYYDVLHTCSPIHILSYKYSHVDKSYNNLKFLVTAILNFFNGGNHKNRYNVLHSCPSIHTISCKYSHVDQSYNNFEFSVAAILKKIMEAITGIM